MSKSYKLHYVEFLAQRICKKNEGRSRGPLVGCRRLRRLVGRLAQHARKPALACQRGLVDQPFGHEVIEAPVIVAGLEAIASHPRYRLPRAEIAIRLERYRQHKG